MIAGACSRTGQGNADPEGPYTHTDPAITAAVVTASHRISSAADFESRPKSSPTLPTARRDHPRAESKGRESRTSSWPTTTREHNIFSTDSKQTLTTDKLSRLHDPATRSETDRILKQSV